MIWVSAGTPVTLTWLFNNTRLDTTRLNDNKSFTFTFTDDPTGETEVVTLTNDEIKNLNF